MFIFYFNIIRSTQDLEQQQYMIEHHRLQCSLKQEVSINHKERASCQQFTSKQKKTKTKQFVRGKFKQFWWICGYVSIAHASI